MTGGLSDCETFSAPRFRFRVKLDVGRSEVPAPLWEEKFGPASFESSELELLPLSLAVRTSLKGFACWHDKYINWNIIVRLRRLTVPRSSVESATFLVVTGKLLVFSSVGGLEYGLAPILGILLREGCLRLDFAGLEFHAGLLFGTEPAADEINGWLSSGSVFGRSMEDAIIGYGSFDGGWDDVG